MTPNLRALFLAFAFSIFYAWETNAQVRLDPEEAEKLVVEQTEALYPAIAKQARADGIVRIEIIVSDQGVVTAAKAISGHPLLQAAAVSAVKKRKYKTHYVDGKPVSFITDVYIRFPSGVVTAKQKEVHDRQVELADQYFERIRMCRAFVKEQNGKRLRKPVWGQCELAINWVTIEPWRRWAPTRCWAMP